MLSTPLYIHGLGPVGLTLALGAARLGLSPQLVGNFDPGRPDMRAWSLLPRSQAFLAALGVDMADQAQRVQAMSVWHADENGTPLPGRIQFTAHPKGKKAAQPISYIVPGQALNTALHAAVTAANIPICGQAPARGLHLITQARDWPSSLSLKPPKMTTWGYAQTALTGRVNLNPGAGGDGTARQVFLPTGPLALLPLPIPPAGQAQASLIWSLRDTALKGLQQRWDLADLASHALGVQVDFAPQDLSPFPLTAAHARTYVGQAAAGVGFAVLGDAAHRIHPLAGMGLNLGLGDVGACLDALVQAQRTGTDMATLPALTPYDRARRAENESLIFATDGLARLFGQGAGPLRLLAGLGMGLVGNTGIKHRIQAMMSDDRALCRALQSRRRA